MFVQDECKDSIRPFSLDTGPPFVCWSDHESSLCLLDSYPTAPNLSQVAEEDFTVEVVEQVKTVIDIGLLRNWSMLELLRPIWEIVIIHAEPRATEYV